MSTQFPEPEFDKYEAIDGWIFPNRDEKKFVTDPYGKFEEAEKIFNPMHSFEYQQGIFGQYRLFYSIKNRNNYTKACFKMCITPESLLTDNLTQRDKVCARECLISSEKFEVSSRIFLDKRRVDRFAQPTPLNEKIFFS